MRVQRQMSDRVGWHGRSPPSRKHLTLSVAARTVHRHQKFQGFSGTFRIIRHCAKDLVRNVDELGLLAMRRKNVRTTVTLAGLLLLATAGLAHAHGPTTVVASSPDTERVTYEPSELASEGGIRDLRSRVRHAAHRVCMPRFDPGVFRYNEQQCFSATLIDAFAQIDRAVAGWARAEQPRAPRIVVAAR